MHVTSLVVARVSVVAMLLLTSASLAEANFVVIAHSVEIVPLTEEVDFSVTFNQAPDFVSHGPFGQLANQFGFYIIGDPSAGGWQRYDSEIFSGNPPVPDGEVGIYDYAISGAVIATTPFALSGDTLTFSVPLSLISTHTAQQGFDYQVETYLYGATASSSGGHAYLTPEPGGATLLGIGTAWLAVTGLIRSRRCRSWHPTGW